MTFDEFTPGMLDSIERAGAQEHVVKKLASFAKWLIIADWHRFVGATYELAALDTMLANRPALEEYESRLEKIGAALDVAGTAARWKNEAERELEVSKGRQELAKAYHDDLHNLKEKIRAINIGAAVLAVLEDNHLNEVANALADLRDSVAPFKENPVERRVPRL